MLFLVTWVVRAYLATWRVTVTLSNLGGAVVYACRHEELALLLAARNVGPVVLVSRSRDGERLSGVLRLLGLDVVRGSSSRGGAHALRALVRALRSGKSTLVTVDGPKGPRGIAKGGAAAAARLGKVPLVSVRARASAAIRLPTWDRLVLPLPFSRVEITCA